MELDKFVLLKLFGRSVFYLFVCLLFVCLLACLFVLTLSNKLALPWHFHSFILTTYEEVA